MEDVSEKLRGRCIRKWRFSKRKTAFAGYKMFRPFILSSERVLHRYYFFQICNFIKFWCGAKFSNITKWQYFLDELNLKFKNKTCQEISKITKWHYVVDELNLKFKNKHVTIIFDSTSFGTLGKNWHPGLKAPLSSSHTHGGDPPLSTKLNPNFIRISSEFHPNFIRISSD